jgi:hypothetical protein
MLSHLFIVENPFGCFVYMQSMCFLAISCCCNKFYTLIKASLNYVSVQDPNEVLESGEETFFPALHVGMENKSAVVSFLFMFLILLRSRLFQKFSLYILCE